MSGDDRKAQGGGLSAQTLVISSISAVAATVVVSQFWEKGTLIFTAMVPIVVALVSEALKRPAEKLTQVAPLVVPARRTPTGTAVYDEAPGEPRVPEAARRALPADAGDPFGLYEPQRPRIDRRRWLRAGLATGAVAFLVAAAAVTASELTLFGGSVGGGDRRTTYFGGRAEKAPARQRERGRRTTTSPQATATPEAAATPGATASPSTTPEATATPAQTATAAPSATPPPAATAAPGEADPAAP